MKIASLFLILSSVVACADPRPTSPTTGTEYTSDTGKPFIFETDYWRTDWLKLQNTEALNEAAKRHLKFDQFDTGLYPGTPAPFEIYRGGDGNFSTNLTVQKVRDDYTASATAVAYVNSNNGHDVNNSGSNPSDAFATVKRALEVADIIYLSEGFHFPWRPNELGAKSACIIGTNDKSWVCYGNKPTWTTNANFAHLRDGTGVGNVSIVVRDDLTDDYGAPLALKRVTSQAICAVTPESFYAPANVAVINTATPDAVVVVAHSTGNPYTGASGNNAVALKHYFENVTFLGQRVRFAGGNAGDRVVMNRCRAFYNVGGSGDDLLDFDGIPTVIMHKVTAGYSERDVSNYHAATVLSNAYEVDCRFFRAGLEGAGSHQVTTIHDGGQAVRINGRYSDSNQVCVDTTAGTESWNLGCHFFRGAESNIRADDNAVMNFEGCTFGGNPSDASLHANGGTINIKRSSATSQLISSGAINVLDASVQ